MNFDFRVAETVLLLDLSKPHPPLLHDSSTPNENNCSVCISCIIGPAASNNTVEEKERKKRVQSKD